MTITPDNVKELPSSDITLFLTVIHWWNRSFGADQSELMFKSIASKTDMLAFEPPGEPIETETVSLNNHSTIEEYWMSYLEEVLDKTVDIEYLGKTEYMEKGREDLLYMIDTSKYSITK